METSDTIMNDTAAKAADKVIEFDVSKASTIVDEFGDVKILGNVDLKNTKYKVLDVPK